MPRHLLQADIGVSVEKQITNYVTINTVADLPTPSAGTHTLAANTAYFFAIGTFSLSDTLTLGDNTHIYGVNKTATILSYTGVGTLINATNSNFTVRDMEIQAATGTVFGVTNTSSFSQYCEQVNFRNCQSLGTIAGGGSFWKYTLAITCGTGILYSGSLGSIIMDTASFRAMSGGANSYSIKVANGTTGNSFRIYNSIFDASATHYGIWVDGTYTLSSGAVLRGNAFTGAGTRTSGFNANTSGWEIPSRSNQGLAGLFMTSPVIVTGTLASTTSSVWLSVTQQVLTRNSASDYEPNATSIRAILTVAMSHDVSGGSVGYRLFNLTDGIPVAGSEVAAVIITTGGVYQVFDTPEVTLDPAKEYRVQIIKNTGTGSQNVLVNAGVLNIKAF